MDPEWRLAILLLEDVIGEIEWMETVSSRMKAYTANLPNRDGSYGPYKAESQVQWPKTRFEPEPVGRGAVIGQVIPGAPSEHPP